MPVTMAAEQSAGGRGGGEPEEDVEEANRRIDGKKDFSVDVVKNGAEIIRTFIEDYHEKLGRITCSRASTRRARSRI